MNHAVDKWLRSERLFTARRTHASSEYSRIHRYFIIVSARDKEKDRNFVLFDEDIFFAIFIEDFYLRLLDI